MALRVRAMSETEVETIRQLAHSRTALARTVERARIVWLAHQGRHAPAIAQELPSDPHDGPELAPALQWCGAGRVSRQVPAGATRQIHPSASQRGDRYQLDQPSGARLTIR